MRRALMVLAVALGACSRDSATPATTAPAAVAAPVSAAPPTSAAASAVTDASAAPTPPAASSVGAARAPVTDLPAVTPKALLAAMPSPAAHASAGFVGPVDRALDAPWISRLAAGPVARVEWQGGGVSLTFRVKFADGKKGVFKPDQTLSGSNFRAEIAAFHLDRLLGFGRVAVVVGRAFPLGFLRDAGTDEKLSQRLERELVSHDGRVDGCVIAWHASPLVDAEPKPGWRTSMSGKAPIDDAISARAGELSDMTVFDYLLDNTDRWSGGNVLSLGKGGPLVFLDNASALLPSRARSGASLERDLAPVCRFRRKTVAAIRADRDLADDLAKSVARDPLGVVLDPRVVDGVRKRLVALRTHVARCEREVGDGMWIDDG